MEKPHGARRSRRPPRRRLRLRWLALAGVVFICFLYYQPVRSYLETRAAVDERRAEVELLEEERRVLERRLEQSTSPDVLLRQARRLGLVRPGERLYIVKGIEEWRKRRTKLRRDG